MKRHQKSGFALLGAIVIVAVLATLLLGLISVQSRSTDAAARAQASLDGEVDLTDASAIVGFVALTKPPTERGRAFVSVETKSRQPGEFIFDGRLYRLELSDGRLLDVSTQDEAGLLNVRFADADSVARYIQTVSGQRPDDIGQRWQVLLNGRAQPSDQTLIPQTAMSLDALLERTRFAEQYGLEAASAVRRDFSAAPYSTSLNLNTARPQVLRAAMDLEQSELDALLAARQTLTLFDVNDVAGVIGRFPVDASGRIQAAPPNAMRIRVVNQNRLAASREVRFLLADAQASRPFYMARRPSSGQPILGSVESAGSVSAYAILDSSPQRGAAR